MKALLELPANLDKKTKKNLEAYHKKIKHADIWVEDRTNNGLPTIRISFETYNKKNRGFMEVTAWEK